MSWTPLAAVVYWRVERLRRDGVWRQISPEGTGGLYGNRQIFERTKAQMRRGTIRIIGTDGTIDQEHTA